MILKGGVRSPAVLLVVPLCVVGILGCRSLGSFDLAALPLQGSSSEFEIVAMEAQGFPQESIKR